MRKYLLALVILACAAWAANLKLYMKDGSYHIVREYQVQADRVHFYSVERSDWEDVPLDLVDLKRTESEAAERKTRLEEDAKVDGAGGEGGAGYGKGEIAHPARPRRLLAAGQRSTGDEAGRVDAPHQ